MTIFTQCKPEIRLLDDLPGDACDRLVRDAGIDDTVLPVYTSDAGAGDRENNRSSTSAMNLRVYQLQDRRYLLVPDCILPSLACRRRYGAMCARGLINVADTRCDEGWREVLADFDTQTYAVLEEDRMTSLFEFEVRNLECSDRNESNWEPSNLDLDHGLRI